MNPNQIKVCLKLPYYGRIDGIWEPNESEKNAAWEFYYELINRVAAVSFRPEDGLLREALHDVFVITGDILRKYDLAALSPPHHGKITLAYLAESILDYAIRPFLAKWHPILLDYEKKRLADVPISGQETEWRQNGKLTREVEEIMAIIVAYATLLANAAGVSESYGEDYLC